MWKRSLMIVTGTLLSAAGAQGQLLDVRQSIYGMD